MKKTSYEHMGMELFASSEVALICTGLKKCNACCESEVLRVGCLNLNWCG